MYICNDCNSVFKYPKVYKDAYGFSSGIYEEYAFCPHCLGTVACAVLCEICGEYYAGNENLALSGKANGQRNICKSGCVKKAVNGYCKELGEAYITYSAVISMNKKLLYDMPKFKESEYEFYLKYMLNIKTNREASEYLAHLVKLNPPYWYEEVLAEYCLRDKSLWSEFFYDYGFRKNAGLVCCNCNSIYGLKYLVPENVLICEKCDISKYEEGENG